MFRMHERKGGYSYPVWKDTKYTDSIIRSSPSSKQMMNTSMSDIAARDH